ncbi:MAG TPA: hypothetical protein VKD72_29955 [Gemmataceae bacterium]|nr:hypothetical protein [Gemmataceae bacterium]
MKTNHPEVPWLGPEFFENQRKFPPEQLMQYAGQHIAWSWDGSRVLASDPDEVELKKKLEAAGINTQRVVFGYIDPLDQVNL